MNPTSVDAGGEPGSGAQRWLCADLVDWESIREGSTLHTRQSRESGRMEFGVAAGAFLAAFIPSCLLAGHASVWIAGACFGWALLACALVTVAAERAADWQLVQAGAIWRQAFEARGSRDSHRDIDQLVNLAARMDVESRERPASASAVDDAIMETVEGLAFCHGVNMANKFPPMELTRPSALSRACIRACVMAAKAMGIREARRLLPDQEAQELLWRRLMPLDVAAFEEGALSRELAGSGQAPSRAARL